MKRLFLLPVNPAQVVGALHVRREQLLTACKATTSRKLAWKPRNLVTSTGIGRTLSNVLELYPIVGTNGVPRSLRKDADALALLADSRQDPVRDARIRNALSHS